MSERLVLKHVEANCSDCVFRSGCVPLLLSHGIAVNTNSTLVVCKLTGEEWRGSVGVMQSEELRAEVVVE